MARLNIHILSQDDADALRLNTIPSLPIGVRQRIGRPIEYAAFSLRSLTETGERVSRVAAQLLRRWADSGALRAMSVINSTTEMRRWVWSPFAEDIQQRFSQIGENGGVSHIALGEVSSSEEWVQGLLAEGYSLNTEGTELGFSSTSLREHLREVDYERLVSIVKRVYSDQGLFPSANPIEYRETMIVVFKQYTESNLPKIRAALIEHLTAAGLLDRLKVTMTPTAVIISVEDKGDGIERWAGVMAQKTGSSADAVLSKTMGVGYSEDDIPMLERVLEADGLAVWVGPSTEDLELPDGVIMIEGLYGEEAALAVLKTHVQGVEDAAMISTEISRDPLNADGLSRSAADQRAPYLAENNQEMIVQMPGGIDLDSAMLNMESQGEGTSIPIPIFSEPVPDMKIEGGVFFNILNIAPADVRLLLGLNEEEGSPEDLSYRSYFHPMMTKEKGDRLLFKKSSLSPSLNRPTLTMHFSQCYTFLDNQVSRSNYRSIQFRFMRVVYFFAISFILFGSIPEAIAYQKIAKFLNERAVELSEKGHKQASLEEFKKVLAVSPHDPTAKTYLKESGLFQEPPAFSAKPIRALPLGDQIFSSTPNNHQMQRQDLVEQALDQQRPQQAEKDIYSQVRTPQIELAALSGQLSEKKGYYDQLIQALKGEVASLRQTLTRREKYFQKQILELNEDIRQKQNQLAGLSLEFLAYDNQGSSADGSLASINQESSPSMDSLSVSSSVNNAGEGELLSLLEEKEFIIDDLNKKVFLLQEQLIEGEKVVRDLENAKDSRITEDLKNQFEDTRVRLFELETAMQERDLELRSLENTLLDTEKRLELVQKIIQEKDEIIQTLERELARFLEKR